MKNFPTGWNEERVQKLIAHYEEQSEEEAGAEDEAVLEHEKIDLQSLLSQSNKTSEEQLELFALLNLGILESLSSGLMAASEALHTFFHAQNGLFVRQQLSDEAADEIMSRGVQLPDLFDVLSSEEAQREFQRELAKMRQLCLGLLEQTVVTA